MGLDDGRLTATIKTDRDGCPVTQVATLNFVNARYRLSIETDSAVYDSARVEKMFDTRQSLEIYLEENTRFRLGDFVSR